jgi:hypothetical protein
MKENLSVGKSNKKCESKHGKNGINLQAKNLLLQNHSGYVIIFIVKTTVCVFHTSPNKGQNADVNLFVINLRKNTVTWTR